MTMRDAADAESTAAQAAIAQRAQRTLAAQAAEDAGLGGGPDVAEQFGTGGWQFTSGVAAVFDDHVRASVPFYDAIQNMIAECADWLAPEGATIADLGAATGNTALAILDRHKDRKLRFHLYDESAAMLSRARPAIDARTPGLIDTHVGKLPADGGLLHQNADLTIIAFVLQFLPYLARVDLLRQARQAAGPTGALLIAEKISPDDGRWNDIGICVSHDYKASQGISDQAIRAKERALRGVLIPYPLRATEDLIEQAGWSPPEVLFRWHQWVLLGAFAGP